MRWWLLLFFCGSFVSAVAQDGQIQGIVFDKDTKDRVAKTEILNTATGKSFYDNLQGEFKIDAKPGDKLIFTKEYYRPDTVLIKDNSNIAVYLQRLAIPLKEVTIKDSLGTPQSRLAATKKSFSKAYGSNAYSDPFSVSPGSGAGISIDAIWNSLSRSGRNAKHLQGLIQRDYEQNVIDYRFNKTYVGNITGLKEKDLADFMVKYRPGYYTVTTDTEYEFVTYIRNSFKRYRRNKRVNQLPQLYPPQSNVTDHLQSQ